MLSIVVAHSYFLRFDRKQLERAKPYPPLATLQVASMLRQAGHAVRVFDAMLADGLAEYEELLLQIFLKSFFRRSLFSRPENSVQNSRRRFTSLSPRLP